MTTVIAVVTKSTSIIAADTLAYEASHNVVGQPKVFQPSNSLLIGVSGSYAVLNCIMHHMPIPRRLKGNDDRGYVHGQLHIAIRNALVKFNLLTAGAGEQEIKGEILIVYRGKIYVIQSDFSLIEVRSNFYAIGSGYEYTTAAYRALEMYQADMPVASRMQEAIKITSQYCPSVNNEITTLHYRHETF